MSTSQQLTAIPNAITSPEAKLVYLSLLQAEDATVTDLQELLGLSKLTLFAVLESLVTNEFVQRTEDGYVCQ